MCTGIEIALFAMAAGGTALQVHSQIQQGNAAEDNAEFQAKQAEADARAAQGEASVEAERIRKASKQQRAAAVAAAAASGVDVDSPTAIKIDDTITNNAEQDAVLTILQGKDRGARMQQQAQADRNAGAAAKSASRINAGATLLSGAADWGTNYGKGWKRAPGDS